MALCSQGPLDEVLVLLTVLFNVYIESRWKNIVSEYLKC